MLSLKDDSVRSSDLSPQLLLALIVADGVYQEHGVNHCVITSLNDGVHSITSLHYNGNAADLRVWGLSNPADVADEIKARLSIDYDVVFEGDHIHIEYQPRRREL